MTKSGHMPPILDFYATCTHVLLNPRLPESKREQISRCLHESEAPEGLVWIETSGSSGAPKLVGLRRQALLCSAKAVNRHLEVEAGEAWLLALPTFHVGGLGVLARALLTGSRVVQPFLRRQWSPLEFVNQVGSENVALSALVPTQLADLVQLGKPNPGSLRALVIGGDAVSPQLYSSARQLGYPVLPSYGLTECASQVATAPLASLQRGGFPDLELLSHVEASIQSDGLLRLRSPSLLEGYVSLVERGAQFVDPKQDRCFVTEDRALLNGRALTVQGRGSTFIKVAGEGVNLAHLARELQSLGASMDLRADATISALPDARMGAVVALVVQEQMNTQDVERLRDAFNERVLPYERIRAVRTVQAIPRTELGKIRWDELRRLVNSYTGSPAVAAIGPRRETTEIAEDTDPEPTD